MIVDKINQFITSSGKTLTEENADEIGSLSKWIFKRQFIEDISKERSIRISNAGKCPRALAYIHHKIPECGKEIDSRGKMTFWYGDLTELTVTKLAVLAGVNLKNTGTDQKEVSIKIGDFTLTGHPDGIVDEYLFECKSMTDWAFKAFEKGIIDDVYVTQCNLYIHALGLTKCVIVAFNKQSCVLSEQIIDKDEVLVARTLNTIKQIVSSTNPESIEKRYGELEGKGFYSWRCCYCSHWKVCLPEATRVVVSGAYKLTKAKGE